MSFTTDQPIISRDDGTFIIDHDGFPYHVVSKELDPHGIYDFDEVADFVKAHPELIKQDTLEQDQKIQSAISMRDGLLKASDWTQLPDSPVNKSNWASYRKKLRDWPSHPDFPDLKSLPSEPK